MERRISSEIRPEGAARDAFLLRLRSPTPRNSSSYTGADLRLRPLLAIAARDSRGRADREQPIVIDIRAGQLSDRSLRGVME
jgi:hypothetical protein